MDRRGNNDTSNFFNRIKNVDVLRSPFPRHLAQPSRQPAMAASARPMVGGGLSNHGTMRPSPMRAVPSWQSPVPRPSNFNISPAGSHARAGAAGRVSPSPAFYHPSTEYPSSVQPIRVRPYPAGDYRNMPGSTFPAHITSALPAIRSLPPNTPYCILRNWYVSIDTEKLAVTVSGSFAKPNGTTVARHSSPIDIAFDERVIVATSGTVYQLVDMPDLEMMRLKGLPEYLIPSFAEGFPRNWKRLVDEYLGTAGNGQHNQGYAAPRIDGPSRPAHSSLTNGRFSDEHRFGAQAGGRFQPISEDSEGPASLSPISPPASVSLGYANARQLRSPSVSGSGLQNGVRPSVYRSGSDIFADSRFARAGATHVVDRPGTDALGSPPHPRPNSQATDASDATARFGMDDGDRPLVAASNTSRAIREQSPSEHVKIAFGIDAPHMAMETPTRQPVNPSRDSLSPELGVTSTMSQSELQFKGRGTDEPEAFKLDDPLDGDSEQSGPELDHVSDSGSDLASVARTLAIDPPAPAPKLRRVSRKAVESSDESCVAAGDDSGELKLAARALPSTSDASAAYKNLAVESMLTSKSTRKAMPAKAKPPVAPKSARKAATATPAAAKPAGKTPKSAPVGLAKRNMVSMARRSGKQPIRKSVEALDHTPTKKPLKRSSSGHRSDSHDSGPVVLIERSRSSRSSSNVLPPSESSVATERKAATSGQPGSKQIPPKSAKLAVSTSSAEKTEPSGASEKTPIKKPPTTPSSTPKRKLGRNHFQYKEPKVSPSVTRSGRKVRRPQEWWTNAQEHLSSTHKESDIKYRWGTGDAVLVKDGKRYRLSDVLLADQAAEPLSSSTHKSDTSDAQPAAGNSSNSSNE